MGASKNIAVFRMGRLGDFISAIPALGIIKRQYPNASIIYITSFDYSGSAAQKARKYVTTKIPEWFELYHKTLIDDVVFIDNVKSISQILALRKKLKCKNITDTVLLPFANESLLSRIKKHTFLHLAGLNAGFIHTPKVGDRNKPDYVSETTWAAVQATVNKFGINEFDICYPEPSIPQSAFQGVINIGKNYNFNLSKIAVIAVGATYSHKQLPENRFSLTIKRLAESGFTSVIIGSNNNHESGEKLFSLVKDSHVVNLVGQTTFMELAALMSIAKIVIGNDGGPMHLAAAFGAPTLTIMSAIYKENIWAPTNRNGTYIKLSPNCSGCRSESFCPNGTNECINEISAENIVNNVNKIIYKH
jgi:ADP-heptose:LPS heptosyltransferase